jgi:hypothetical protein
MSAIWTTKTTWCRRADALGLLPTTGDLIPDPSTTGIGKASRKARDLRLLRVCRWSHEAIPEVDPMP